MLKTIPSSIQVIFFLILLYAMAVMGQLIYVSSINLVVDQSVLEQIDGRDPRIILSRNLFFQVFAFLLTFSFMLRLMQQRFEDVVFIQKIQLKYVFLTFGVFALGMFIIPILGAINDTIRPLLPSHILEKEVLVDQMNERLIYTKDGIQFLFSLIIMGLLPAICEELVFRGFLMKKMMESGMKVHGAVILSSVIFTLSHMQPLKFLPMFFLALCLGYIYVKLKNIKYAILLHFLVNSSQILYGYLVASQII